MRNIAKTPSAFFIRCTVLVFCLAFAQRIWADCHLTVTLSGATGDVIVAGDDNKASLAITANPVLTRDEGEQRELVNGECGEGSYTFNWSPQPSSTSHSGGAGFLLQPGVHTISCTVTYQDECCRSTATGSCTVEVVQSCKNRKSDVTETIGIELPDIQTVTGKLSQTLRQLPFCSDAGLAVRGGVQAKIGEMCCQGTEETDAAPVQYQELSGNIGVAASVQFSIPGWNGYFDYEVLTPIRWKAEFSYVVGPTVTPSANATLGVSGQKSSCGECVNIALALTGTVRVAFGATCNASLEIFEQGNWYSINTDIDFTAEAFGETGFGGDVSYQNGQACDRPGLTASAYFGSLDVGITFSATYNGMGLSYTVTKHLSDGFSTNE